MGESWEYKWRISWIREEEDEGCGKLRDEDKDMSRFS